MSSSSPCAARAAARAAHVPASMAALSSPRAGWRAILHEVSTMNNNESMSNNNTTPTSSTAGTSISTLTADNIPTHNVNGVPEGSNDVDFVKAGRGGGFDDEILGREESGGGEEDRRGEKQGEEPLEEELPPLQSIFDCAYIVVRVVNDGKDGWECRWCGKIFSPKHASRALSHVLRIRRNDIAICKAAIPGIYHKRYSDFYKANMGRQAAKKHSINSVDESVAMHQAAAVGNLLRKRGDLGAVSVQQSSFVTPSSTASHLSFAGGASTSSTLYTSVKG